MSNDLVKRLRERSRQYVDNEYNFDKRAADRIEQLELVEKAFEQNQQTWLRNIARIEKLEAALRSIAANTCCDSCREAALVARKALEGKDD